MADAESYRAGGCARIGIDKMFEAPAGWLPPPARTRTDR